MTSTAVGCLFVSLAFHVLTAQGVRFTPSSLAAKMRDWGVSEWEIPSLVCLAHNASDLDTSHTSQRSDTGYNYYGIFGIPNPLFDHKPCKHMNEALALDSNIDDDLKCLTGMIKDGGFFKGSRSANVAVFTKTDIDLAKCFDWFESLPSFLPKDDRSTTQPSNQNSTCDSKTDFDSEVDVPEVNCFGAGLTTNLLLFLLDLSLFGLIFVGYKIFTQMRVNYVVHKFNENSLL